MPKRSNPFGECSPLQFKIHVGKKEVDMGINKERNMKQVYDKTRELLFQGSKKSFQGDIKIDANENVVSEALQDVPMEEECVQASGQLQITASGTLTAASQTGQAESKPKNAWSALFSSGKQKVASGSRVSCRCCRGQAASQARCAFCDQAVCSDCIRACISCCGHFCQLCSIMNYEGISESSYCLSCAS